jgi:hypothetical protein
MLKIIDNIIIYIFIAFGLFVMILGVINGIKEGPNSIFKGTDKLLADIHDAQNEARWKWEKEKRKEKRLQKKAKRMARKQM